MQVHERGNQCLILGSVVNDVSIGFMMPRPHSRCTSLSLPSGGLGSFPRPGVVFSASLFSTSLHHPLLMCFKMCLQIKRTGCLKQEGAYWIAFPELLWWFIGYEGSGTLVRWVTLFCKQRRCHAVWSLPESQWWPRSEPWFHVPVLWAHYKLVLTSL